MINRFRIQSFKIIGELELALDRLTMLVGPNACGKSSVLQAMHVLCAMRERWPAETFSNPFALFELVTHYAQAPLSLRAEGESFALEWSANAAGRALSWSDKDAPQLVYENKEGRHGYRDVWHRSSWSNQDIAAVLPFVSQALPKAELFRFELEHLAAPAVISRSPTLGPSGLGLAAVLGHLALEYPNDFQRIKEATLSVVTSIHNIRLRNTMVLVPTGEVAAHELIFDTKSGNGIPARAMSDGTMRVLALLTAALGHLSPRLILLDDIERGVHPRAMIELVRLLQKALDEVPNLQIVATTHSPDLLDQLKPGQIRLLWLGEDGLTRCVPMNEHPDFETWRDIMTPGEMWAVFDRKNAEVS